MPLHTFIYNLLNVLVQIAHKRRLQKKTPIVSLHRYRCANLRGGGKSANSIDRGCWREMAAGTRPRQTHTCSCVPVEAGLTRRQDTRHPASVSPPVRASLPVEVLASESRRAGCMSWSKTSLRTAVCLLFKGDVEGGGITQHNGYSSLLYRKVSSV
jgi:hypothetical protein